MPLHEMAPDAIAKPRDDRKKAKLDNGLEYLLISNPELEESGAALNVNVGRYNDPKDVQGIAHLLEHWTTRASKKYTGKNSYIEYVRTCGGYVNATARETSTIYCFRLPTLQVEEKEGEKEKEILLESLRRLADILSPIHDPKDSYTEQIAVVNKEHKLYRSRELWRLMQVDRSLANPDHPYHRFDLGNKDTLSQTGARDAALELFNNHYIAKGMKLVVKGKEPLEVLERWVKDTFTPVRSGLTLLDHCQYGPMYRSEDLGLKISVKGTSKESSLRLRFPYPDEDHLHKPKPGYYIAHLVGHESPGSILAFLVAKQWANTITPAVTTFCPGSSVFDITIGLTSEGVRNQDEVCMVVFQYIALLQDSNHPQYLFNEMKIMSMLRSNFDSPRDNWELMDLSMYMRALSTSPTDLLSDRIAHSEFDFEAVKNGLKHLAPDKLRLTFVSSDHVGEKTEKWYGAEYSYDRMSEQLLSKLGEVFKDSNKSRNPALYLPSENEFVLPRGAPEIRAELSKPPRMTPELIRHDENVQLWYKLDDRFRTPKVKIHISLRHQSIDSSVDSMASRHILQKLIHRTISDSGFWYFALMAGLECKTKAWVDSFDVIFSGYSDKMLEFLRRVMGLLRDILVDRKQFDIAQTSAATGLRNATQEMLWKQLQGQCHWLLGAGAWSEKEILDVFADPERLDALFERVQDMASGIVKHGQADILVHGNLSKEEAQEVANIIVRSPGHRTCEQPGRAFAFVLRAGSNYYHESICTNETNSDNGIEYLLYTGSAIDYDQRAKTLLFAQMVRAAILGDLRDKQGLGYIMLARARIEHGAQAFCVLIQSGKSPDYLQDRIEHFLSNWQPTLDSIEDKDFEQQKKVVATTVAAGDRDLEEESDRLWGHIKADGDFEEKSKILESLKNVKKEHMQSFFETHISPESKSRAKLVISMLAQSKKSMADSLATTSTKIRDVGAWKAGLEAIAK